jgi:hypothetical protein
MTNQRSPVLQYADYLTASKMIATGLFCAVKLDNKDMSETMLAITSDSGRLVRLRTERKPYIPLEGDALSLWNIYQLDPKSDHNPE